jgi:hypothetical protein
MTLGNQSRGSPLRPIIPLADLLEKAFAGLKAEPADA